MNALNTAILEGNATQDAEIRDVGNGRKLCAVTLATDRLWKDANGEYVKETSFIDCEAWGALAERLAAGWRKGRGARIVGRLRQNRWTDTGGKAMSRVVLVCENVEFKPETKQQEAKAESQRVTERVEESEADGYAIPF